MVFQVEKNNPADKPKTDPVVPTKNTDPTYDRLSSLIFPKLSELPEAERLAKDPSLKNIAEVFKLIHNNTSLNPKLDLSNETIAAEESALIVRSLEKDKKTVSPENIREAYDKIKSTRDKFQNFGIYEGKNTVLAVHNENAYEAFTKSRDHTKAETVLKNIELSGSETRFGTPAFIDSLNLAIGDKADLNVIRADNKNQIIAHRLTLTFSLNANLFDENSKLLRDPENAQKFLEIIASQTGLKKENLKIEFGEKNEQGISRIDIKDEGRVVISANVLEQDGKAKISNVGSIFYDNKKFLASVLEQNKQIIEAIKNTPPGPNGFVFYHDGHESTSLLGLSQLSPDPKTGKIEINEEAKKTSISIDQFADAFVERYKKFPNKGDVIILAGCLSGSFVDKLAEKLGKKSPVLISASEIGVTTEGAAHNPVGSEFNSIVVMPKIPQGFEPVFAEIASGVQIEVFSRPSWDAESFKQTGSPTLGDLLQVFGENPLVVSSNPRILVPLEDADSTLQIR